MVIIIPAYQPDEKLYRLVIKLKAVCNYSIIIVNDGSSEDRKPLFDKLHQHATVLNHATNRGKGASIKTALGFVQEHYGTDEGIVTVDADGQHLPEDVVRVSETWKNAPEKLVLGSRRFTGKVPFKSRAGNAITRFVFRLSTGVKLFDTQTGLRVFSASRIPMMLSMKGNRYEYEINVLLYATRHRVPIEEVPIETVYIANNASSHFQPLRDGWRIYKMIIFFVASSLIAMITDYVLFIIAVAITTMPMLSRETSLLISVFTARVVSSFINYFINRKIVFDYHDKSSVFRYYLLVAAILAANYGLMLLITRFMPAQIGKLFVELLLYPVSFLLQRIFVFPPRNMEDS